MDHTAAQNRGAFIPLSIASLLYGDYYLFSRRVSIMAADDLTLT